MLINFDALEQALAPISLIGQGELTFNAGSTKITLRALLPEEELSAQKHAATALDTGEESAAIDYLDRLRSALLSYSIVAIGDQDFRTVDYVTTGGETDGGNPIKITKDKALRGLLSKWNRTTLSLVFSHFHELQLTSEREAEEAIEYEPSSIPAEIDRLKARIEDLEQKQLKVTLAEQAKLSDKIAMASTGPTPPPITESPQEPEEETPKEPSPQVMMPPRTGPISPQQAAPPPERPAPQAPAQPQQPEVASSFFDAEDDGGIDQAMADEHNRLMAMRQRAQAQQPPMDEGSAMDKVHPRSVRPPPHLAAQQVEEDLGLVEAARQEASIDGVPVFAMPTQALEPTGPRVMPDKHAVNPTQDSGQSRNPRFQASRKP